MATNLAEVVTYYEKLRPTKLRNRLNMWLCETTWYIKNIISLLPQCLWPPSLAGLLYAMRNFSPLSKKFLWYVISSVPQWLWLPYLTRWFYTMKSFLWLTYKIPWSRVLARSRDKLDAMYLYYHKTSVH